MQRRFWFVVPVVGFSLAACTCLPKGVSELDVGVKDRGIASWYGQDFDGWITASGELYDMEELTAAHRTLPLGTVVRVTNVMNGKQIRVRINDRGPYVQGRVLDVSLAAARHLGMTRRGITPVQVEVIGLDELLLPPRPSSPAFLLSLWHNSEQDSADDGRLVRLSAREAREFRLVRLTPTDVLRERRPRRAANIFAAERPVDVGAILPTPEPL